MARRWSLIIALAACIFFVCCRIAGAQDMTLKERVCNGDLYARHATAFNKETDYECAVNQLFNSIMTETPRSPFLRFYTNKSCYGSSKTAYGNGFCSGRLIPDECTDCLNTAKDLLFYICTHSIGARVELKDCQIRYESYPFAALP